VPVPLAIFFSAGGSSMALDTFLQQLSNGLILGCLYALIAIGYTMVYGILRLINFAHGDIFMMSMYFAYFVFVIFNFPWYVVFSIAAVLTALLGVVIEKTAYRPLRSKGAPKISLLISTIGVSYLLQNLSTVLFSGRPKEFMQIDIFTDVVEISNLRVQGMVLWVPVVTAALVLMLTYVVHRTKTGLAMRALAKDADTARLMGMDINRTIMVTFGIGSILASIGGMFWGMKYPQVTPTIGIMPGLKCFIAAVLGGIGNINGAVLGGLLLGLIETMTVAFLPSLTSYRDAFAFVALIVILLVKPSGIVGEKIVDKV